MVILEIVLRIVAHATRSLVDPNNRRQACESEGAAVQFRNIDIDKPFRGRPLLRSCKNLHKRFYPKSLPWFRLKNRMWEPQFDSLHTGDNFEA